MKFKITFITRPYLSFFISLLLFNTIHAQDQATIGTDFKFGINYVTHLYTLGNIGYTDPEYTTMYGKYLPEEDKKILRQHKDLLAFGSGKTGKLTSFFFFMPAYSDLKTYEGWETYFENIHEALDKKSFKPIMKYIPAEKRAFFNKSFLNAMSSVGEEFDELSWVFLRNFNPYVDDVYPEVVPELKNRKKYLNSLIKNEDIINKWQDETGYTWNKGDYTYLLFRAGKNGPSFNNLSENTNSLYYNIDEKYIIDMFSHEFGIFLMYDSVMPLAQKYKEIYPDYKSEYTIGRPYWMAYEMLSIFFNIKIHSKKTMDYYTFTHADPIAFMEIYSSLYDQGITNPKEMYEKGVNEYMKPGGYWESGVQERYESIRK